MHEFLNLILEIAKVAAAVAVVIGVPLVLFGLYLERKNLRFLRRLERHFQGDPKTLAVVTRTLQAVELPSLHRVLSSLGDEPGSRVDLIGVSGMLAEVSAGKGELETLRFAELDLNLDEPPTVPSNGLYLARREPEPLSLAVQVLMPDAAAMQHHMQSPEMQVMAASRDVATKFIAEVRDAARRQSVFRGKVLSLERGHHEFDEAWMGVRFHELSPVAAGELVLPDDTRALIERNTVRFFRHADAMRRSGQSVRKGLLFHGPPGTGKTATIRWLASALPDVSVLLVAGEQLWDIKRCCQVARWLAPALIVIEDVDLIAESRDTTSGNGALHQLMNEMDGLAPDAPVIFVLTTNRPEVLEEALVNRPGRIDQAVHFPLPDPPARRKLLELFARTARLPEDLDDVIDRTDGASPAFLKELVRKAVQTAVERDSAGDDSPALCPDDFRQALEDLALGSGDLTGRLFGFHARAQT